jgi:hypothetical protein
MGVILVLCVGGALAPLDAQPGDGPLGLQWGVSKEAVEKLGLRLCCRQVGLWGARYEVDPETFRKFPRSLGDEKTVYLYFGNTNKLLRVYVAIVKEDGESRFKQLTQLTFAKYKYLAEECTRKAYGKYEALEKGTSGVSCKEYEKYVVYKQDDIEVFIGLEKQGTNFQISMIHLHEALHNAEIAKDLPL